MTNSSRIDVVLRHAQHEHQLIEYPYLDLQLAILLLQEPLTDLSAVTARDKENRLLPNAIKKALGFKPTSKLIEQYEVISPHLHIATPPSKIGTIFVHQSDLNQSLLIREFQDDTGPLHELAILLKSTTLQQYLQTLQPA